MGNYTLNKRDMTNLKSRLTRAKNSNDPSRIIEECKKAFNIFDERGYPDNWHTWNIALDDAELELRRRR